MLWVNLPVLHTTHSVAMGVEIKATGDSKLIDSPGSPGLHVSEKDGLTAGFVVNKRTSNKTTLQTSFVHF